MGQMAEFTAYGDETTPVAVLFKPINSLPFPLWRESSAVKPLRAKCTYGTQLVVQNNGIRRRVAKLVYPIMEQTSGAAADGNVAPPKVAHEITVSIQVIAHERATETQIANAAKMAMYIIRGDETAGIGDAYKNSAAMGMNFLIQEVVPS